MRYEMICVIRATATWFKNKFYSSGKANCKAQKWRWCINNWRNDIISRYHHIILFIYTHIVDPIFV